MVAHQHASVLTYAGQLKKFNFFDASDAMRVNSQRLYILAKVLRVFWVVFKKKQIVSTVNKFSSQDA